ncbi:hypothetical protein TN53_11070 [Streptomyces sp. WM6386]|nr:hypothetical protein TN53_11070 [Streptomyces sp. WM6386]
MPCRGSRSRPRRSSGTGPACHWTPRRRGSPTPPTDQRPGGPPRLPVCSSGSRTRPRTAGACPSDREVRRPGSRHRSRRPRPRHDRGGRLRNARSLRGTPGRPGHAQPSADRRARAERAERAERATRATGRAFRLAEADGFRVNTAS